VTTSYVDLVAYALLLYLIVSGGVETVFHNLLASSNAYDYRRTVAIWFRGVFPLQDHVRLMSTVPFVYQFHAVSAWAIIALWPFTRLVHVWSNGCHSAGVRATPGIDARDAKLTRPMPARRLRRASCECQTLGSRRGRR
jgi:nitrate reductase gamma subunit